MAFLGSVVQYLCLLVIMVIAAALGLIVGKKLRADKDAKEALEASDATTKE